MLLADALPKTIDALFMPRDALLFVLNDALIVMFNLYPEVSISYDALKQWCLNTCLLICMGQSSFTLTVKTG